MKEHTDLRDKFFPLIIGTIMGILFFVPLYFLMYLDNIKEAFPVMNVMAIIYVVFLGVLQFFISKNFK
jgi:hypothetical protein